ncbi:hemerythrin HHE cation binding domain protein [bacterium BMS3Bbin03]|nr:hemerythrin HHE cation binding domain protein [bacterium BMS3Bbin03]HDZ13139.1 DUF438 domain-containing protein [Bacteroidota bacterium]
MSELINNARKRKDLLKHMILQLHKGEAPDAVKKQLIRLMGQVPYSDVVMAEQELIAEGMPQIEILKLCDLHSAALKGIIEKDETRHVPPGHPVHTFEHENRAIEWEIASLRKLFDELDELADEEDATDLFLSIRKHFNALLDVEKHYQRKENLLFPFLEKNEITGPSTVMWGKHNEIREFLKASIEALEAVQSITAGEAGTVVKLVLIPAVDAIEEMIFKEEQILFPMSLDVLAENDWIEIYRQSLEIGFCLYDPKEAWLAAEKADTGRKSVEDKRVFLPSGSFTVEELNAILNTIPFDLTFVDKTDTVRYFSQGAERIFERNRAILGRKVQHCHPPSSVHIVQRILDDFHSGRENRAAFWINLKGRFIHIEYFALRGEDGRYLGTLETSQDLTGKRELKGEQRLLNYVKENNDGKK